MSTYFLRRFAERLIADFPSGLEQVTVVLPTRRARLFLMRHLHELKGGAFWAPRCIILPDWVRALLPGRIGGEIEMFVAMYNQYRTVAGGRDDFGEFLGWAGVALRDFNDVDAALASGKRVYSDLRNIREIEQWDVEGWSFDKLPLSVTQEEFLNFWMKLGDLYHAFVAWQDEEHCWTYARAVRFLAEHPESLPKEELKGRFYFVGIGSYSAAERKLIQHASECAEVQMVWDLDAYYFDDKEHEAGTYARRHGAGITSDNIGDRIGTSAMNKTIVECGTTISQVMRAAEVMAGFTVEELENTCVVINDEGALEPLLSALTDVKVDVNLAIAKPLQQTQLSRMLEEIFVMRSLQLKNGKIYYKPFTQLLHIVKSLGYASDACHTLLDEITENNIAQVTPEYLLRWSGEHPQLEPWLSCFTAGADSRRVIKRILDFLQDLEPSDDFMKVARFKLLEVFAELAELTDRHDYMNSDQVMLKLYQLVIGRMKMHYQGEPIQGLQLLSLSETRALDFEKVLFLGANEEFFPGERFEQSFIPFDLRSHYKLPMPEDADAIHSYTYHRLLHEAKDVFFFYSTVSGDSKLTERSRYVIQLVDELEKRNTQNKHRIETIGTVDMLRFRQGVPMNDFIRDRLKVILERGLSPTAINKLVACPLDFYYRYVANLGEEVEVEENMSAGKFGEIVHKVLEDFYRPFANTYPAADDLLRLKSELSEKVNRVVGDLYSKRGVQTGEDFLSIQIAVEMLSKYIDTEVAAVRDGKMASRKLMWVEESFTRIIDVEVNGSPVVFSLKGKLDRADEINGVLNIIDYKTGGVKVAGKIKEMDFSSLFTRTEFAKLLQLMVYIMLTRDKEKPTPRALFYSMKEKGGSYVEAQDFVDFEINHDTMDAVEKDFARWVQGLFEMDEFNHNTNAKYCEYCFREQ